MCRGANSLLGLDGDCVVTDISRTSKLEQWHIKKWFGLTKNQTTMVLRKVNFGSRAGDPVACYCLFLPVEAVWWYVFVVRVAAVCP